MHETILKKTGMTVIAVLTLLNRTYSQQRISFNRSWKFTGIEFGSFDTSVSVRKLGKNWNDQFLIDKRSDNDSSVLHEDTLYADQINMVKNRPWQDAILPHIAFPEPLIIKKPREGLAFYKKNFFIAPSLKGKSLSIEFEGAMQVASVWFNGHFISTHLGGYLPFTIDISKYVHYGGNNNILVRLDNRPNSQIPPGKPVMKLDFIYYSGIYRDVWLHIRDPLHITDANTINKTTGGGIFVTYPQVSTEKALINIRTNIINEYATDKKFSLIQQLITQDGKEITSDTLHYLRLAGRENKDFVQCLIVHHPALWHPDSPHLYRLKTIVLSGRKIVDTSNIRIGIRSFSVNKESGLFINGKPFRIQGTNRHMSYPWIGNALSDAANYRDAILIKNAGMNCIRLCHYPQDPSFYDACDSLGILLIDCIPGWQFFNSSKMFRDRVADDIRQTIRRDRNHPSIFLWEMSLNETYPPAEFRCFQNEVAKSEWPGGVNFYTSGDSYFVRACWDVPYDDWANNAEARNNTTYPDNAFLVREYGDYEFGGGSSTTRQLRGSGEKGLLQQAWNLQWEHNRNRKLYPRCIGDLNWAFFDGLAGVTTGIEGWGLSDIFRIPKFSYYFFKSQNRNIHPMVFTANYWTQRNSPSKVIVYSNCNEIALYLNGKLIARQKPDSGPDTHYGTALDKGGRPFTGGDAGNLVSPPFTFFNIPYEGGELKAIGFNNGDSVAQYIVYTPKTPSKLKLSVDTEGIPLTTDGADAVFVHAVVLDRNNHPIYTANNNIRFSVTQGATIISPSEVNAEAGIATVLLRAGTERKTIVIKASADGLMSDTLIIQLK